jgi:hypothetical protein
MNLADFAPTYSVEVNEKAIAMPTRISNTDLTQVKEFVNKIRDQYPLEYVAIFEHTKKLIDD